MHSNHIYIKISQVLSQLKLISIDWSTSKKVFSVLNQCALCRQAKTWDPSSSYFDLVRPQYGQCKFEQSCEIHDKSYVKKASKEAGSAAAGREDKKVDKYSNLSEFYHFVPVGVETYGAYGPQGLKLVKQIGKKIQDATGEKLSTFYLFQRISIAIQKGNAKCVTDCVKDRSSGLEVLFNFHVQEAEELWLKLLLVI